MLRCELAAGTGAEPTEVSIGNCNQSHDNTITPVTSGYISAVTFLFSDTLCKLS